jgi:hypothetical protein
MARTNMTWNDRAWPMDDVIRAKEILNRTTPDTLKHHERNTPVLSH